MIFTNCIQNIKRLPPKAMNMCKARIMNIGTDIVS